MTGPLCLSKVSTSRVRAVSNDWTSVGTVAGGQSVVVALVYNRDGSGPEFPGCLLQIQGTLAGVVTTLEEVFVPPLPTREIVARYSGDYFDSYSVRVKAFARLPFVFPQSIAQWVISSGMEPSNLPNTLQFSPLGLNAELDARTGAGGAVDPRAALDGRGMSVEVDPSLVRTAWVEITANGVSQDVVLADAIYENVLTYVSVTHEVAAAASFEITTGVQSLYRFFASRQGPFLQRANMRSGVGFPISIERLTGGGNSYATFEYYPRRLLLALLSRSTYALLTMPRAWGCGLQE